MTPATARTPRSAHRPASSETSARFVAPVDLQQLVLAVDLQHLVLAEDVLRHRWERLVLGARA